MFATVTLPADPVGTEVGETVPVGKGSVVVVGVGAVVAEGTVDVGLVTGSSVGLEEPVVAVVGSASVVVVTTVVGVSVSPPVMVGMA
jgi:predicted transcriptional regulator